MEFAKQIGEMLEQISYIDDCDTLGQKANKKDIHEVTYSELFEVFLTLSVGTPFCLPENLRILQSRI